MRRLASVLALGLFLLHSPSSSSAQEGGAYGPVEQRLEGMFWDLGLSVGLGVGLDAGTTPMAAQLRGGGLFAAEPLVFSYGLALHLGGLHRLGVGAQLELSHLDGVFLDVGAAYARGEALVNSVTLGYRMVGVQYVHRAFEGPAYHALFLVLRLPLGLWLAVKQERDVPAQLGAKTATKGVSPGPDRLLRSQADRQRKLATKAEEEGRLVEAEAALHRAQTLAPSAEGLLWLARVQVKRGRLVEAIDALGRFVPVTSGASEDARAVLALRAALRARVPVLRLAEGAKLPAAATLTIDDTACSLALSAGYECLMNPGRHTVRVEHQGVLLMERVVEAQERSIERLDGFAPIDADGSADSDEPDSAR